MQILGIAVDRLGTASRLIVGVIALATIGVIVYIVMSAGGAAYTPAFTNLDARSAGDLQSALAGAGIATKLSDGGATVLVPSSKVERGARRGRQGRRRRRPRRLVAARQELAVADRRPVADEGAARALRDARVADRGDLRRLPRDRQPGASPSAACSAPTRSRRTPRCKVDSCDGILSDSAVRGIVALVANGIPGLTPQNISVIDQTATRCPTRRRRSASPPPTPWRPSARGRTRRRRSRRSTLDKMVGVGAGSAIVAGQLNFDETTEKSQTFGDSKGADPGVDRDREAEAGRASGRRRRHRHRREHPRRGRDATAARARTYDHNKKTRHERRRHDPDRDQEGRRHAEQDVASRVVVDKKALKNVASDEASAQQIIQDTIANAIGLDTEDATNKISVSAVDKLPNPVEALKAAGVSVGRRRRLRQVRHRPRRAHPGAVRRHGEPDHGRHRPAGAAVPGAQVAGQAPGAARRDRRLVAARAGGAADQDRRAHARELQRARARARSTRPRRRRCRAASRRSPRTVPPTSLRSCAAGSPLTPDGRRSSSSRHHGRGGGGRRRRRAAAALATRRKAAIMAVALGPNLSAEVFKHLLAGGDRRARARDRRRSTRSTPDEQQPGDGGVLRGRRWPRTSSRRAASGSRRTCWSARSATRRPIEIMGRLSTYIRVTPFEFLRKIDPIQIFNFLQHEHPQTIALVMAYLPADGARPGDGHVPAGGADRGRDAHRRDGPHGARGAARGRDRDGAQALEPDQPGPRRRPAASRRWSTS